MTHLTNFKEIQELSKEIDNFTTCYHLNPFVGVISEDGDSIDVTKLLEWLIENPHIAEIAGSVSKLLEELNRGE